MLFTGTIRSNLAPFGEVSDSEMWAALRRAHLAPVVEASSMGLDMTLSEGGAPLSAGQKQLIALARAVLRRAKVCCADTWPMACLHPDCISLREMIHVLACKHTFQDNVTFVCVHQSQKATCQYLHAHAAVFGVLCKAIMSLGSSSQACQ